MVRDRAYGLRSQYQLPIQFPDIISLQLAYLCLSPYPLSTLEDV